MRVRTDGQAIAVLSAVSVMGFVKSMDAEGPYRVKDGYIVRGTSFARNAVNPYYAELGLMPPKPKDKNGGSSADAAEAEERAARAEARRLEAEEAAEAQRVDSFGGGYGLLVPLLYAPIVPLMRVGLRGRVSTERLTQLTLGVIAVALAHAGSYMFADSSVAIRR